MKFLSHFSGAYRYPIYFVIGAFVGQMWLNNRRNYWADRDAVLRHYVQLHPEDFAPPGIIQLLDIFFQVDSIKLT